MQNKLPNVICPARRARPPASGPARPDVPLAPIHFVVTSTWFCSIRSALTSMSLLQLVRLGSLRLTHLHRIECNRHHKQARIVNV